MQVRRLSLGLWAGVFFFLMQCVAAQAITMTTVPEIEAFNLSTTQVTFHVSNDSGTITNNNNSPTSASQILTFNQFNSALGALTNVTITFTTSYGATVTLSATNNGFDNGLIDFFADAKVDHTLTGIPLIVSQSSPQTFSAHCSADEEASCSDTPPLNTSNFNGTAGLASPLSSFQGPGTYDLTATLASALAPRVSPDNGTSFADNSTMDGTLNANWNGNISVVYTYDAPAAVVPEPLSLYLLVAGLGGIALSRRRR